MKITDKTATNKTRIPEVGEVWRHIPGDIFIRIPDESAPEEIRNKRHFYSLNLSFPSDGIGTTSKDCDNIEILDAELIIKTKGAE